MICALVRGEFRWGTPSKEGMQQRGHRGVEGEWRRDCTEFLKNVRASSQVPLAHVTVKNDDIIATLDHHCTRKDARRNITQHGEAHFEHGGSR